MLTHKRTRLKKQNEHNDNLTSTSREQQHFNIIVAEGANFEADNLLKPTHGPLAAKLLLRLDSSAKAEAFFQHVLSGRASTWLVSRFHFRLSYFHVAC